jgi:hypothetical protein
MSAAAPGITVHRRFVPNHPRSYRIEMDVITHLPQISPSAAIHQKRFVTTAKEMARETVTAIELLRIGAQEPLHPGTQVAARSLYHQVKVIAHQAIGMNLPSRALAGTLDNLEKQSPIHVIPNDRLPPIASAQDMVNRAGIFYPQWSGHDAKVIRIGDLCQYLALTLFASS